METTIHEFSKTQRVIIAKIHQGKSPEMIMEELNLSRNQFDFQTRRIFNKLHVKNWIAALRAMFDLVNDEVKHEDESVSPYITDAIRNILRLRRIKSLRNSERKLAIYTELLELYSNIQFKYTLKYH